jgi:hypothetical protein
MDNGAVKSYVRFYLQKIQPVYFRHLLLPTVVEHTTPLLRPPHMWSLLLVETVVLEFRFGAIPRRWSFPE